MSFWPETLRFVTLSITLQEAEPGGMTVYTGALPAPFTSVMTKNQVRSIFGEPMRSDDKLERSDFITVGMGGSDVYRPDTDFLLGTEVEFQYTEALLVERLSISVNDL